MKVLYNNLTNNDFLNTIGLFYEVRKDIKFEYGLKQTHNHEIKTYLVTFKSGEIDFKLYATYFAICECDIDQTVSKLKNEGYIDLTEWCKINKERLVGNQDIISLIKKK